MTRCYVKGIDVVFTGGGNYLRIVRPFLKKILLLPTTLGPFIVMSTDVLQIIPVWESLWTIMVLISLTVHYKPNVFNKFFVSVGTPDNNVIQECHEDTLLTSILEYIVVDAADVMSSIDKLKSNCIVVGLMVYLQFCLSV